MRGAGCTKKFRLNGRLLARRISSTWSRAACVVKTAQGSEPSAPALETAAASAGPLKPLIGAWMIGWLIPSRSRRSVRGHISSSLRRRDGGSVARTLAAIDVNGLARHEARRFQIEDGAHDLRDLAHPAKRVQLGELRM